MTGTSLDGIDISLVKTNGIKLIHLNQNFYHKYDDKTRNYLLNTIKEGINLNPEEQAFISNIITNEHINALENLDIIQNCDLIGFHGQTIYHNPNTQTSIQLGNPEILAKRLKKDVIYDFRSRDIELGGHGAPLAPIYHKFIIESLNLDQPSCVLNIGGVANLTYWDGRTLIGFDTGPGNALMDDYAKKISNNYFDMNGEIASKGIPDKDIVKKFLRNSFFNKKPPKSLDRNYFKHFYEYLLKKDLSTFNLMASLAELTIETILLSFNFLPAKAKNILVSGGGCKNRYIMDNLEERLKINFIFENDHQLNMDYVESELIAYLSARSVYNLPFTYPSTTGVSKIVSGGKKFSYL